MKTSHLPEGGPTFPWPARRADVCTCDEMPPASTPVSGEPLTAADRHALAMLRDAKTLGVLEGEVNGFSDGYRSGWRWGLLWGVMLGCAACCVAIYFGVATGGLT